MQVIWLETLNFIEKCEKNFMTNLATMWFSLVASMRGKK